LQTKSVSRADALPAVWCSTADDLVNADDFRLAVMKNDLKLIETFLKRGKSMHLLNVDIVRVQFVNPPLAMARAT